MEPRLWLGDGGAGGNGPGNLAGGAGEIDGGDDDVCGGDLCL